MAIDTSKDVLKDDTIGMTPRDFMNAVQAMTKLGTQISAASNPSPGVKLRYHDLGSPKNTEDQEWYDKFWKLYDKKELGKYQWLHGLTQAKFDVKFRRAFPSMDNGSTIPDLVVFVERMIRSGRDPMSETKGLNGREITEDISLED